MTTPKPATASCAYPPCAKVRVQGQVLCREHTEFLQFLAWGLHVVVLTSPKTQRHASVQDILLHVLDSVQPGDVRLTDPQGRPLVVK